MFILAKRNIIIPSPAPGVAPVVLKKDGFATVPDWAAETAYFKALEADGKIVATEHRDKDIQAALIARFESKFKHPYKLTRCIQNEENFGLHRYSRFERI